MKFIRATYVVNGYPKECKFIGVFQRSYVNDGHKIEYPVAVVMDVESGFLIEIDPRVVFFAKK